MFVQIAPEAFSEPRGAEAAPKVRPGTGKA
jgi:hypothetical protein